MLEVGVKAPDFTLKDKDGKEVALSSFRGKKVVLYFYPKDNTPGCTRQACAFAGAYAGKLRISLKIAFRQLCLKQPFGGHYLQGLLFLYPESPCYVHMCANIRLISNGWDFRMIWKCMRVYKNFIWGW